MGIKEIPLVSGGGEGLLVECRYSEGVGSRRVSIETCVAFPLGQVVVLCC